MASVPWHRRVVPEKTHDGKKKRWCVFSGSLWVACIVSQSQSAGLRDRAYAMGYVTIPWPGSLRLRPASQTTGF